LGADENEKTVVQDGANHIPIGTCNMLRQGNHLEVDCSLQLVPYVMDSGTSVCEQIAPVKQRSASFLINSPYRSGLYFTSHTFVVEVSAFAGKGVHRCPATFSSRYNFANRKKGG
jgi:hypothetical protein